MTAPNGIGAAIQRATIGSTVEVRWAPQLSVVVDGQTLQGIQNIEVHSKGTLHATAAVLVFVFQGGPTTLRAAQVSRACSAVAANAAGDGLTASMTAVA